MLRRRTASCCCATPRERELGGKRLELDEEPRTRAAGPLKPPLPARGNGWLPIAAPCSAGSRGRQASPIGPRKGGRVFTSQRRSPVGLAVLEHRTTKPNRMFGAPTRSRQGPKKRTRGKKPGVPSIWSSITAEGHVDRKHHAPRHEPPQSCHLPQARNLRVLDREVDPVLDAKISQTDTKPHCGLRDLRRATTTTPTAAPKSALRNNVDEPQLPRFDPMPDLTLNTKMEPIKCRTNIP